MSIKKYRIVLDGREHEVEVEEIGSVKSPSVSRPATAAVPAAAPSASAPVPSAPAAPAPAAGTGGNTITAPMQGRILDVNVKAGDSVKSGQVLLIIEAMKMENEVVAPRDGVVDSVSVSKGDAVVTGDPLVTLR